MTGTTDLDIDDDGFLVLTKTDGEENVRRTRIGPALDLLTLDDERLADVFSEAVDLVLDYAEAVRFGLACRSEAEHSYDTSRGRP